MTCQVRNAYDALAIYMFEVVFFFSALWVPCLHTEQKSKAQHALIDERDIYYMNLVSCLGRCQLQAIPRLNRQIA